MWPLSWLGGAAKLLPGLGKLEIWGAGQNPVLH
jgi:hypothetical protein